MAHTRHWTRLSAVIMIALLLTGLLSACGDDDDSAATETTPPTSTATSTATGTPLGTATMALAATQEMQAMDMDAEVGMNEFAAAPPPAPAEALREGASEPGGVAQQAPTPAPTSEPQDPDAMFFEDYGVNPFLDTEDDHLSTFAMDVDMASYTLTRGYLMNQQVFPPPDAIRPEEFINYFNADYASPPGDDAFAIHLDAAPAPFGYDNHLLFRVGLQGRYIAPKIAILPCSFL